MTENPFDRIILEKMFGPVTDENYDYRSDEEKDEFAALTVYQNNLIEQKYIDRVNDMRIKGRPFPKKLLDKMWEDLKNWSHVFRKIPPEVFRNGMAPMFKAVDCDCVFRLDDGTVGEPNYPKLRLIDPKSQSYTSRFLLCERDLVGKLAHEIDKGFLSVLGELDFDKTYKEQNVAWDVRIGYEDDQWVGLSLGQINEAKGLLPYNKDLVLVIPNVLAGILMSKYPRLVEYENDKRWGEILTICDIPTVEVLSEKKPGFYKEDMDGLGNEGYYAFLMEKDAVRPFVQTPNDQDNPFEVTRPVDDWYQIQISCGTGVLYPKRIIRIACRSTRKTLISKSGNNGVCGK